MGPLLLDTDILIDYLRGRAEAIGYLDGLEGSLSVSVITVAELYAGVREGPERGRLDAFMGAFEIVPIDRGIAVQGGLFRRDFGASHGIGLPDAREGACALLTRSLRRKSNARLLVCPGRPPVDIPLGAPHPSRIAPSPKPLVDRWLRLERSRPYATTEA